MAYLDAVHIDEEKIQLEISGRGQTSEKVHIPLIQVPRPSLVHIYLCRSQKQHFLLQASVAMPTSMTNCWLQAPDDNP